MFRQFFFSIFKLHKKKNDFAKKKLDYEKQKNVFTSK